MRNHPPLAMPLPLAASAAPTPRKYCQCQDFTFNKFRKSLKDNHLPPPPFSVRLRSFRLTQRLDDRFAAARRFMRGRVSSGLYGSMAAVPYPLGRGTADPKCLDKPTVPRGQTAETAEAVG